MKKPTYRPVTERSLIRAKQKAVRIVRVEGCTRSMHDAGHVIRGKDDIQVFVTAYKFSENLLKHAPLTGGLVHEDVKALRRLNIRNWFDELIVNLTRRKRKWSKADRFRYNQVSKYLS